MDRDHSDPRARNAPGATGPLALHVASPADLSAMRHAIDSYLSWNRVAESTRQAVVLCVSEAATNALIHSGGGHRPVEVSLELASEVVVAVRDYGRWAAPTPGHVGRGLGIIEGLAREVSVDSTGRGTTLRFSFAMQ